MKNGLARFLPTMLLLLPACTVDTPIVEGSDRFGESLEDWCESFCSRGIECDAVDCHVRAPARDVRVGR